MFLPQRLRSLAELVRVGDTMGAHAQGAEKGYPPGLLLSATYQKHWDWWNKHDPEFSFQYMSNVDRGRPQPEAVYDKEAKRHRAMLDAAHQMEAKWGSKAEYIQNYFPHEF